VCDRVYSVVAWQRVDPIHYNMKSTVYTVVLPTCSMKQSIFTDYSLHFSPFLRVLRHSVYIKSAVYIVVLSTCIVKQSVSTVYISVLS
jgi:hypothetical protein